MKKKTQAGSALKKSHNQLTYYFKTLTCKDEVMHA